jgi:hypothetical protein
MSAPASSIPSPRVLSVIPPMTQLNTPYPSTAYITGFLRSRGVDAVQVDLALALVLDLFTPAGRTARVPATRCRSPKRPRASVHSFAAQHARYAATMAPVHRLPAGARSDAGAPHRRARLSARGAALRIARVYIHRSADGGDPLAWAFGALGVQDRARHFATLYLNDVADVRCATRWTRASNSCATPSRWRSSQPSFDPLAAALAARPRWSTRCCTRLTRASAGAPRARVVLLSVPFPGALYARSASRRRYGRSDPSHRHRARRRLRQHRTARTGRAPRVRLLSTT